MTKITSNTKTPAPIPMYMYRFVLVVLFGPFFIASVAANDAIEFANDVVASAVEFAFAVFVFVVVFVVADAVHVFTSFLSPAPVIVLACTAAQNEKVQFGAPL